MADASLTMTDAVSVRDKDSGLRSGTPHLACVSTINNNGREREIFEDQRAAAAASGDRTGVPGTRDDDTLDAGISSRL